MNEEGSRNPLMATPGPGEAPKIAKIDTPKVEHPEKFYDFPPDDPTGLVSHWVWEH